MIEIKSVDGVTISIADPWSLIEMMSSEDMIAAVEALSCSDAVIEHVANQIMSMHGCTENGSSGSSRCSNEKISGGGTALDKARYQVACSASETSAALISLQTDEIVRLRKELDELKSPAHSPNCRCSQAPYFGRF